MWIRGLGRPLAALSLSNEPIIYCLECPPGSACGTGAAEPSQCSPGTVAPNASMATCDRCAAGTYQAGEGGSECLVCGAGNYSSNVLSCEPCQVGEYCELAEGLSAPKVGERCPPGSTTDGRGATSKDDCGCYAGSYDASGSLDCVECTEGMNCTAANTRTRNLPVAKGYWRQHYWSAPPNGSLSACFTEEACLGGANLSADIFCAPSQQGPYCAVCRDGYFGGGDGALCEPCEGHAVITFLPVVLIGIVLLAVLTYVIISCYRKEDILGALITASSEFADAVASELEDADATSTFGLVGTAVDTVRDKAVEQTEARAKDWAVRHIADQMETNDVKAKFAKAKKTDAERDAERLKAAVHHKYPKTVARARWFKAKAEALGVKLKILISLYQMLQGIGITFNIRWPEAYGDALRFLGSVVQIDLPQAMPMDCIANFGFFGALIVRTAIPLLLVMLLAGLSKLYSAGELQ